MRDVVVSNVTNARCGCIERDQGEMWLYQMCPRRDVVVSNMTKARCGCIERDQGEM